MKTALITGGAARIGAQIAKTLHSNNLKLLFIAINQLKKLKLVSEAQLNNRVMLRSFQEILTI